MALVYKRYQEGLYGVCPRALCDKMRVIPHGLSEELRRSRCKVFCPKCEEVYIPTKKTQLDGASFGTSFAHMFLDSYKS